MNESRGRKIDFETAYEWLNFADQSRLEGAAQELILELEENLQTSAADRDRAEVWIESLESLSSRLTDEQAAIEVLIRCGRAAYQLGMFQAAERLLVNIPQRLLGKPHHTAAVGWLLGCVRWCLPEKQSRAIQDWQRSINAFDDFARWHPRYPLPREWYQKQLPAGEENPAAWYCLQVKWMNDTLQHAIKSQTKPKEGVGATDEAGNEAKAQEQAAGETFVAQDRVEMWNVYASIPAGEPGEMPPESSRIGEIHIDRVWIDGRPHRIINLRGSGSQINLLREVKDRQVCVLRVAGNSMNAARPVPIQNGDYVLLRMQKSADDGDIVAAEIPHEHEDSYAEATLKRYHKRGADVVLQPESSEDIPPFEFAPGQPPPKIRGIALAVFKVAPPSPKEPAAG